MSDPNGEPKPERKVAQVESQEKPRGALFVIWNRKDNTFLLQQRDENCQYFPQKWCFPGEHRKEDEEPDDAAVRGALKEYELTIKKEGFVPLVLHKQPHAEGYTQVFVAELPEGQEAKFHEGRAMAWQTLPKVKKLIDEGEFGFGQQAFFDTLQEYIATNSK